MKTYCKPFKRGKSWRSQNFGTRGFYNPAGGHTGNDDAAPVGEIIHAAGDGFIEFAGEFDSTYADNLLWLIDFGGNTIVLNCGDDEPTFVYAHMEKFYVRPGQFVRKGEPIGECGNTGTATTGSHCHNECILPGYVLNSPTLGRVNPDIYMTEWPEDIIQITTQAIEKDSGEMAKPIITLMEDGSGTIYATENFVEKWGLTGPEWLEHYRAIHDLGWIEIRGGRNKVWLVPAFGK